MVYQGRVVMSGMSWEKKHLGSRLGDGFIEKCRSEVSGANLQDEKSQEVKVGRSLELLVQIQGQEREDVVLVRLDGISLKTRKTEQKQMTHNPNSLCFVEGLGKSYSLNILIVQSARAAHNWKSFQFFFSPQS